jgi:hypothetical protein
MMFRRDVRIVLQTDGSSVFGLEAVGKEAIQMMRSCASPANRTRTRPGSTKRSSSRPPRAAIQRFQSTEVSFAAR